MVHECARWCVLEAAPKGEERGGKDVTDFFLGGDELCGARALQRYFSVLHGVECLIDGAFDSGIPDQVSMDLGGCRLDYLGFSFLDVPVDCVHGFGVSTMAGGGSEFRDALIFLTRAEEVGWDGVVMVW